MQPRKPLPASVSTVLLYLSHLSQEDEVREGSLNPYLATVNQMHQDAGFRRPALGHYVDLLRKGFANVEAQATSSALVRMPLPSVVVHDILMLGLASSDNETLRQTACIVDFCGVGMMLLPRVNVEVRCIGHYRQKSR
jgi:hypothetical protein